MTGSSNESDMVPEKSSMGEISSKISWSPDLGLTSSPASVRAWTSLSHAPLPTTRPKLLVWRARSLATSRAPEIFAKEIRRGDPGAVRVLLALREAAKRRPSEGSDSFAGADRTVEEHRDVPGRG